MWRTDFYRCSSGIKCAKCRPYARCDDCCLRRKFHHSRDRLRLFKHHAQTDRKRALCELLLSWRDASTNNLSKRIVGDIFGGFGCDFVFLRAVCSDVTKNKHNGKIVNFRRKNAKFHTFFFVHEYIFRKTRKPFDNTHLRDFRDAFDLCDLKFKHKLIRGAYILW